MAINFPDLPSINDIHVVGTITYVWNGVAWVAVAEIPVGTQGVQGIQGAFGVQGRQGPSGPQGIQGVQGRQGPTGIQGITGAGVQGIQGLQGRQGTQGIQGPTGSQGLDGAYAAQGIQGPTGIQGNQGTTGAGTQGSTGAQGYTGIQGIQGRQGIAGQIGTQGVQGTQGIQGNFGVQGPFGPQGIAGEYAAQGIQGPQGLQGDTGIQGIQGLQGRQGTTGAQGTQGRQGTTGFQGATGAQGIQGIYGVQGIQGTQGIQGPQGLDGAYAAQGIQGPQGVQGTDGLQGTQGVQGVQGPQGTQGPQGFGMQGTFGTQGTQGVQGVQGTQGVQGLQGIQGPQGLDGAYAAQGIQGPEGPQGTQGVQGIQGPQGTQGVQGNLGIQGTQGIQGIQGPQGTQGIQGNLGIQGTQGIQGPQGLQGVQGIQGLAGTSFSGGAIVSSWNFNTSTSADDPGSQNFSVNNATLASVTALYFNDTTLEGVDASVALSFLNVGNRIYIQQKNDVTRAALFEVSTAPTDNTGWWTVPVTVLEHNTTLYQSTQAAGTTLFFGGGGTGNGGATVTTADTPPVAPVDGDMWWNSTDGVLYVYYDDGNSSQWVVATPVTTGLQGVQGIQGPVPTGGTKNPDNLPVAPTAYDDEFDDNTLNTSKWTWRNQGTATATIQNGALYLTAPATSGVDLKIIEQTITGGTDWKYRAKLSGKLSANTNLGGLALIESATGKAVTFVFVRSTTMYQQVANFTNVTTYSSTPASIGPDTTEWGGEPPFYFEIERSGSNLYYRFSRSGQFGPGNESAYQVYTSAVTAFFTTAPDRIGLIAAAQNASTGSTIVCDWFRKIEAGYDVTKSSGGIQGSTGIQGLQGVQGLQGPGALSFVGAKASLNTSQTIGSATVTALNFDNEDYDTSGFWSIANPSRMTVPQAGYYTVTANWMTTVSSSLRGIWLYRNGDHNSSPSVEIAGQQGGTNTYRQNVSWYGYLNANDYISCSVYTQTGGDAMGKTSNSYNEPVCWMTIAKAEGAVGAQGLQGTSIQGIQGIQGLQGIGVQAPSAILTQSTPAATSLIPLMTSLTAPSGVISASSSDPSTPAWYSVDAGKNGWVTANTGIGAGQWVKYQFTSPQTVKSYSIIPWSNDLWPARWISSWKLQGSNDDSNWTDLDSRTQAFKDWIPYGYKNFSCSSNTTAYTYYRLLILGNGGNNYIGVQRWELYATDVTTLTYQGIQGPTGIQGIQGPAGPLDTGFSYLDNYELHTAGKATEEVSVSSTAGSLTINPSLSNSYYFLVTEATTLDISSGLSGQVINVVVKQGAIPYAVTFNASTCKVSGGFAITQTANAIDMFSARWCNALSLWLISGANEFS